MTLGNGTLIKLINKISFLINITFKKCNTIVFPPSRGPRLRCGPRGPEGKDGEQNEEVTGFSWQNPPVVCSEAGRCSKMRLRL